ncbi:PEP-CTERM sorting domain-containing protein [Kiritimatiellaeota bacterium B1221]|nr:PEP-CTERM sorting domain-containing protein [Kiritimatiellaeota bacterium B1221]
MKKICTLFLTVSVSVFTQAGVLLNENFEGVTPGDLNGQNGWTADAALDVVAGGLDYSKGDIVIDGGENHVQSSGSSAQLLAHKGFASQSGEVWFSMTVLVDTPIDTNDIFRFGVGENSDATGHKGLIGDLNASQSGFYAGYQVNTNVQTSGQEAITSGQVHFLVGRLYMTASVYDTVDLWVDPDTLTLGVADQSKSPPAYFPTISSGIDTFSLYVSDEPNLQWDNLSIGTSMTDVVIPEPSSFLLLGLGILTLLAVNPRRK